MNVSLPLLVREEYHPDYDLDLLIAAGPFTVDGIRYSRRLGREHVTPRPMFDITSDHGGAAALYCSRPMNDDELNEYVRTGLIRPVPHRPSPGRSRPWRHVLATVNNS